MIIKLQLISLCILQLGWSLPAADNSSKILVNNDVNDNLDDKDDKVVQCKNVFTNAGLNYSSFFAGAAHGIHSLSLEEIRYFFKSDTPEDNKIPTVNIDFRSENDSICMCANDVTSNGILAEVVNIAKQLKYRARQGRARGGCLYSGRSYRSYEGYRGYEPCGGAEGYSGSELYIPHQIAPAPAPAPALTKREATSKKVELEEAYLKNSNKETAKDLLAVSPWIPGNFTGPDQWISYSAMLTYSLPSQQGLRDFATFIYCKLNQPGLDHPADLY